jgi:hypothetical protein
MHRVSTDRHHCCPIAFQMIFASFDGLIYCYSHKQIDYEIICHSDFISILTFRVGTGQACL